jgi:branched-chain amino acid transport system permease protein
LAGSNSRIALGALMLALFLMLPWIANNYILRITTTMLMYSALALSWNFIGGFTGYPSFATAAFFGLGAYVGGVLQNKGVPMVVAWLAAGVLVLAFAAAVGRAILHLKGHYFAIASLVIADVLREVINGLTDLTGGGMGLNLAAPKLGVNQQAQLFYFAMFAIAAAALAATVLLDRSRLGFGLRCIEQNEDAAIRIGIGTARFKTAAFALSSVFVGMAGAVYASWTGYIDPGEAFEVLISVKPIVMTLLGGAGSVLGPVYGAFLFLVLEETVWRNFLKIHSGVLGTLVVLLILFLPRGIMGTGTWQWLAGRLRARKGTA